MKNQKDRQLEKLARRMLALKKADAAADIASLEREIVSHVYRLYGLSPEEIKLVEDKAAL